MGTQTPLSGARVKPLRRNSSSTKSRAVNACACEGKAIKVSLINQSHLRQRERIARAKTFTSLVHTVGERAVGVAEMQGRTRTLDHLVAELALGDPICTWKQGHRAQKAVGVGGTLGQRKVEAEEVRCGFVQRD